MIFAENAPPPGVHFGCDRLSFGIATRLVIILQTGQRIERLHMCVAEHTPLPRQEGGTHPFEVGPSLPQ